MEKPGDLYRRIWIFYVRGMWRPANNKVKQFFLTVLQHLVITTRSFFHERMQFRASALSYSTLISIVPLLAIIFAIAKGFGLNDIIETEIRDRVAAQPEITDTLIGFVNSYLTHTHNGVFIGFGILILLWTLLSLTETIEATFNQIWQVRHPRSTFRKITDYTAMFFLLPVILVLAAGLSIFFYSFTESLSDIMLLGPVLTFLVELCPYLLMSLLFTGLYAFMPNTKVRIGCALAGGIPAGIAFQCLQFFYIHSQIWLSSYNAIYGSFAALPLLMLMCQISWYICLFGATLSYVIQNRQNFYQGKQHLNLSRRHHDYICLLITSTICRRFALARPACTAEELARIHQISIRPVTDILYELCKVKILLEISNDEKGDKPVFVPAHDIQNITAASVLRRIDTEGSRLELDEQDNLWQRYNIFRNKIFLNEFTSLPLHLIPDKQETEDRRTIP